MSEPTFTEAEVVERERAAFFSGAVYGEIAGMVTDWQAFPAVARLEARTRYPKPTVEVPA